jgi:hypothetical protein
MSQKNVNKPNELALYELDAITEVFPAAHLLPEEDQIYLKTSEVDYEVAERMIESAGNFIQVNGKPIVQQAAQPRTEALRNLQIVAKTISTHPEPCTNYITGLKIFYAIRNNAFVLYYRPIKFCRTSVYHGAGNKRYGNYDSHENLNSYYYYDGTDFVEETDSEKLKEIKNHIGTYQDVVNGIKIRHNILAETPFTPYAPDDVTAVTFSFQEFFALMEANSLTNVIRIWNVIEGSEYPNSTYILHALLLSTESIISVGGNVIVYGFAKSFANLSHLCPPSCNKFQYQLVKI